MIIPQRVIAQISERFHLSSPSVREEGKENLETNKEMCFTFAKTSMKDTERHIKIIYRINF